MINIEVQKESKTGSDLKICRVMYGRKKKTLYTLFFSLAKLYSFSHAYDD
jgi:hypothetical protein